MTSRNLPEAGSTTHDRPESIADKEEFSSGGNRHLIILRGKVGLAIDTFILWLTGYSLMTKQYTYANGAPYQPTLLLYTRGARTGMSRRCGLPYFRVDGNYVVRGSNGGGPTDPHWCHNVRGHPEAKIRVKGRSKNVHAHVAQGEERDRIFEILCEKSKSTEQYQMMCAPRELPLVVLREV